MSGRLFIILYYLAEFQSFTSCSVSVPRLALLGASGIGLNVTGTQKYSKVKCYRHSADSCFRTTAVLGLTLA